MPIDPSTVATLSYNGTDTKYQPIGYLPTIPLNSVEHRRADRSETISFIAACVQSTLVEQHQSPHERFNCPALKTITELPLDNFSLETKLIEGVDTRGTGVYAKIAEGTASLIGSVLEERTVLNIQGHSRGAVQSILTAHELDRIKKAFRTEQANQMSHAQLYALLCDSPCAPTQAELKNILSPLNEHGEALYVLRDLFRRDENEQDIRVNLCLLDPVPGNSVLGLPGIGWYDNRYFKIPPIVRHAKITICENEDTACFDCIIPIAEVKEATQVQVHKLLGHHGTLTGNPFGNNGESLESLGAINVTAEHAQIIALYENYDFLSAQGTQFKLLQSECPLAMVYNEYHQADLPLRRELLLMAYEQMRNNKQAYDALNKTVYITVAGVAFSEAFKYGLTRPVLEDVNNTKSSLAVRLPFKSDQFINEIHVKLFMQNRLGLNLNNDLRPCDELTQLIDCLQREEHRIRLNHALSDNVIERSAQEGIQSLVSQLGQLYLQNNLNPDEKTQTLNAINQALTIEEAGHETALEKLKYGLKTKINQHFIEQIYRQVKAHYDDLAALILAMRANNRPYDDSSTFVLNAFAKYKQFKTFKDHLANLYDSIDKNTELANNLPDKMKRLEIYCDATIFFCAKTLNDSPLNIETCYRLAEDNQELQEFIDQLKPIYQGLSGNVQPKLDDNALLFGLSGISLQVLSSFITVLGAQVVAVSLMALVMSSLGMLTITASAGLVGGMALMSFGIYGINRAAKQQVLEQMQPDLTNNINAQNPELA